MVVIMETGKKSFVQTDPQDIQPVLQHQTNIRVYQWHNVWCIYSKRCIVNPNCAGSFSLDLSLDIIKVFWD